MSEDKHLKLDIKKNKWPRAKDIFTDLEVHKPFANFEHDENILGSIPERIAKERTQIGVVGKGTNKLGIGKP